MGWADEGIVALQRGERATLKPVGRSMKGRVESGQTVEIDPKIEPVAGNVVLVKVKGNVYLHLVKRILSRGSEKSYQIGNNVGGINGWVDRSAIYGVMVEVGK